MLIGDGNVSDPVEHFVREMQQAYLPSESMFGWYILVVNLSYSSDETVSWLIFATEFQGYIKIHHGRLEGVVVGKVYGHPVCPGLIRRSVLPRSTVHKSVSRSHSSKTEPLELTGPSSLTSQCVTLDSSTSTLMCLLGDLRMSPNSYGSHMHGVRNVSSSLCMRRHDESSPFGHVALLFQTFRM